MVRSETCRPCGLEQRASGLLDYFADAKLRSREPRDSLRDYLGTTGSVCSESSCADSRRRSGEAAGEENPLGPAHPKPYITPFW